MSESGENQAVRVGLPAAIALHDHGKHVHDPGGVVDPKMGDDLEHVGRDDARTISAEGPFGAVGDDDQPPAHLSAAAGLRLRAL